VLKVADEPDVNVYGFGGPAQVVAPWRIPDRPVYPVGSVENIGEAEAAKADVKAGSVPQVNLITPELPGGTVVGVPVSVVHVVVTTAAGILGNVCVNKVIAAAAVPIIESATIARIVLPVRFRDIFMSPGCGVRNPIRI